MKLKRTELQARRTLFKRATLPQKKKSRDVIDTVLNNWDYAWKNADWGVKDIAREEESRQFSAYNNQAELEEYVEAAGFRVFKDSRIVDLLVALQEVQLDDTKSRQQQEQARKSIETILNAAKKIVGRRHKELSSQEARKTKNEAASRSKAVNRLLKKYDKLTQFYGDPKQALKQVITDFMDSSRIKDIHQKTQIIKNFKNRIARKGH